MSMYGAVLTYTARQGSYRDARVAHAMHVRNAEEINNLIDDWREDGGRKPTREINAMLSEGWTWIGAGLFRSAYLSPKGTVYKVNRTTRDSEHERGSNYSEMTKILSVSDMLPNGFAIPAATLYHVPNNSQYSRHDDYVIAVQQVDTSAPFADCWGYTGECNSNGCKGNEGNKRCKAECSYAALSPLYQVMSDVHSGNAFPDANGIVWVVDVAM